MKQTSILHPLLLENNVRGLVFDLDGTLIDSAADILHAMRLTFEQAGLGHVPADYFPDNLHGTNEGIMQSIIADMGWAEPADFESLKARYFVIYASLNHARTHLYKDVLEVLQACRLASLPMAICTNKVHANAVTATQTLGIHEYFDFITGADTWAEAKPSPVPLLETLNVMGLTPDECLYFGDTSVDAECARRAGVRFVLHESGYGDVALAGTPRHFSYHHWNELFSAQTVTV